MGLNMEKVLDRMIETRLAEGQPEDEREAADRAMKWVEAKGIDPETFAKVCHTFSHAMVRDLLAPVALGRIGVLSNREVAAMVCSEIMNAVGQGFELGYTTAEYQQEVAIFGSDHDQD